MRKESHVHRGLLMQHKLLSAIAVAVLLLGIPQANADTITYAVNDTVGSGTLTGSITTDGSTGGIGQDNILAWNLTITSVITSNLTDSNSAFDVDGGLSATNTGMFFDFSGSGSTQTSLVTRVTDLLVWLLVAPLMMRTARKSAHFHCSLI